MTNNEHKLPRKKKTYTLKERTIPNTQTWGMGNIALFGAILMSHGIVGKEKEGLKNMMYRALNPTKKTIKHSCSTSRYGTVCACHMPQLSTNYMQVAESHCYGCHKTFPPGIYCDCFREEKTTQLGTPCTEKCGRWFKPQPSVAEENANNKLWFDQGIAQGQQDERERMVGIVKEWHEECGQDCGCVKILAAINNENLL